MRVRSGSRGADPGWRTARRGVVLLSAVMIMGTSCGARLSKSQIQAAVGNGSTGTGGVAAGDSGSTGTVAAATPAAGSSPATATTLAASSGNIGGGTGATGTTTPAASSGGAAACKADTTGPFDPGVTATQVSFGNVSVTGGPVPGIFKGARDGAQAFFAYQNSQGGVCGRQLHLDFMDDNLDAAQNQADYQALVTKDLGFVGSFSVVDEQGAQVIGQCNCPDVSYALSKAHFALPNNFSPQPLKAPGAPVGEFNYFKKKFPAAITKMAIFTEDVQAAKDAAAGFQAAAQSAGYAFAYSRVTEPTDTDFTADVSNMKNKGVQGVVMYGDAGQMARIAAAMKAQNFSVALPIWGANAYDPQFIQNSQGGSEGATIGQQQAMFEGEDASTLPEIGLFNQWLRRVGNNRPDLYGLMGWESGRLMVDALLKAGPKPTRATVVAALKSSGAFDGNGTLAPDGNPAQKKSPGCFIVVDVKGGKFVRDPDSASGWRCNDGPWFQA
jgi:ABC-type branched-subunit amino acid transport system substrate-binding protein